MKTVGKCSLLTVISIKDIRFAVENHPQNLPFSVIFFFVYLNYFENCWEMFTFNGYKPQGHSICSRKPPSKFVIGAFFRLHQGHSICSRKPPSKFVIGAFFRLVMFFNGYMHQGHSICSRKPPSKFVIGAFFRLVMLYVFKLKSYLNIDLVGFRFYVRFAVFGHFFFVYLNSYENCWGMFTFDVFAHQGLSICSRKPPSKFDIGSLLRLVMLYKETKKKKFQKSINNSKNTYLFENSTIHR
ncbi:hypothetical protein AGLY_017633 [Aphis glycines]|uniref:Uncharacterized protein n=1 Tax=Aphis glycines TaxID=307491 RepID=A0A6G0SUI4_APHGL|nr:hypothetical protein AGLY_017633 [Aphis glycines]